MNIPPENESKPKKETKMGEPKYNVDSYAVGVLQTRRYMDKTTIMLDS